MRFTPSETREFIHDHCIELRSLAKEAELETAVYLLDMLGLATGGKEPHESAPVETAKVSSEYKGEKPETLVAFAP